jgi:hypothetical protein
MDNWKVLNRVLKYLGYNLEYGLHYIDYLTVLEGYNDANQISNTKHLISTSGYVFIYDETVLSWKLSNKICIIRYTMKLEFISLDNVKDKIE